MQCNEGITCVKLRNLITQSERQQYTILFSRKRTIFATYLRLAYLLQNYNDRAPGNVSSRYPAMRQPPFEIVYLIAWPRFGVLRWTAARNLYHLQVALHLLGNLPFSNRDPVNVVRQDAPEDAHQHGRTEGWFSGPTQDTLSNCCSPCPERRIRSSLLLLHFRRILHFPVRIPGRRCRPGLVGRLSRRLRPYLPTGWNLRDACRH